MRMGVFEYFVEMIKTLPAQAIPNALDLECRMLEDDLKHHRLVSPEDASSILETRPGIKSYRVDILTMAAVAAGTVKLICHFAFSPQWLGVFARRRQPDNHKTGSFNRVGQYNSVNCYPPMAIIGRLGW
jgi:hypothetical protein